jgi:hypothetical protein
LRKHRELFPARVAVRRPEVHDHRLARIVTEAHGVAVESLQLEVRCAFADGRDAVDRSLAATPTAALPVDAGLSSTTTKVTAPTIATTTTAIASSTHRERRGGSEGPDASE